MKFRLAVALAVLTISSAALAERPIGSDRTLDLTRRYKVPTDGAFFLGAAQPKVTVVVFTDMECSACAAAHNVVRKMMTAHPEVKVVVRHFPLEIHKNAEAAARAVLAAGFQQHMPQLMRQLYAHWNELGSAKTMAAACQAAGLECTNFSSNMMSAGVTRMLARDYAMALRFGVHITPTFFVDGIPLETADKLEATVASELKLAEGKLAKGVSLDNLYREMIKGGMEEAGFAVGKSPDIEPANTARHDVPTEGAASRGPEDAPVTLVEFGDFQCPFCAAANALVNKIHDAFPTQVRVVWRNFPLAVHADAAIAAEAGAAAAAQGKFWEFHDAMFRERVRLDRTVLAHIAQELGLDVYEFNQDLASHKYLPQVVADRDLVTQKLGGTGTPTFFINGRRVKGVQRFDLMSDVIKQELARVGNLRGGTR